MRVLVDEFGRPLCPHGFPFQLGCDKCVSPPSGVEGVMPHEAARSDAVAGGAHAEPGAAHPSNTPTARDEMISLLDSEHEKTLDVLDRLVRHRCRCTGACEVWEDAVDRLECYGRSGPFEPDDGDF